MVLRPIPVRTLFYICAGAIISIFIWYRCSALLEKYQVLMAHYEKECIARMALNNDFSRNQALLVKLRAQHNHLQNEQKTIIQAQIAQKRDAQEKIESLHKKIACLGHKLLGAKDSQQQLIAISKKLQKKYISLRENFRACVINKNKDLASPLPLLTKNIVI